uniref:Uncharacterized protein n=1 Tax=Ciona intestinalis TaxID=7719 RepID=H2XST6_CIOIN
ILAVLGNAPHNLGKIKGAKYSRSQLECILHAFNIL